MSKYQFPDAWSAKPSPKQVIAAPTKETPKETPKQVLAKIDMGDNVAGAGLCPSCRKEMVRGFFAGAVPVMVCFDDRVTLPVPDGGINET